MQNYGTCTKNENGEYIFEKEENDFGGLIFKSEDNYKNHPDEPCYIPEDSDEFFTAKDILEACEFDQDMTDRVFEELCWQYPASCYEDILAEE